MGIFSLDLSSPIKIEIHTNDCDTLYNEIKDYII